jgi:hypothetical protein
MNPKFPLLKLLQASDYVTCNGYEIDNYWPNDAEGVVRLMCGDDDIVSLPLDQKIEMTPEGNVAPVEHDGDLYFFEFSVLYTLKPSMLPKE